MHLERPSRFPSLRRGGVAFAALLIGLMTGQTSGALAATAPASGHPGALPEAPATRNGDYRVLKIGDKAIQAKCAEGGTVVVATHPVPSARVAPTPGGSRVHGVSAERDAAIRSACKAVDYTK